STERGKRSARRGWVCARRGRMACGTGATATAASDKWLSGPVAAWCDGPGEKRPPVGVPLPLATLAPASPPAKIVRQTGNFMCYPCVRTPVTLVSGQNIPRTLLRLRLEFQRLHQRFDKEELAPHHRFIHAQVLRGVIHAVLEDAFPAGIVHGQ